MPVSDPSGSSEPSRHKSQGRQISGRRVQGRLSSLILALASAALVAGCSNDTTKDSGSIAWSTPAAGTSATAPVPSGPPLNWQTRLSGDTVTVEIRDPNSFYHVDRVELVGPNGLTVAANEINRTTNRASGDTYGGYGGGPSVGVGVGSWGGSRHSGTGVGVGLGFPLGGSSSDSPPPFTGTITSASVRIPDPAFYRETAAQWIVRISFTDRSNQPQAAVIPAPRPAG